MKRILNLLALLASPLTAAAAAAAGSNTSCTKDTITSLLPSTANVLYVTHQAANTTFTPPPKYNTGARRHESYILPRDACIVQANFSLLGDTQHSVGFVLPDSDSDGEGNWEGWNGRFLTAGNGGFSGSVSWSSIIDASWYGFASVSTDTGHESSSAEWAYHNPAALKNWGYRALHDAVVKGKALTKAYYARDIEYSYYRGCSAGGKQGLKEVQMYPDDFDGVIAGAPAWWTTHLQIWNMIVGIWNKPDDAEHHLAASHVAALADEVVRQCDPQDGVVDGVVMNPEACVFRAETMLCETGETNTSTCLNPAQIGNVYKLHHDWVEANDTFVFPHFTLSSESKWESLIAEPSYLGTGYIKWMMQLGPDWSWHDWNPELIELSDRLDPGNATADEFDLSPFYEKGGKLIHYHGWSDASIATGSSIYFYEQVVKAMQPGGVELNDFYRFFLIPGMGHCSGTSETMKAPWVIAGDGQSSRLGDGSGGVHSVPGYEDAQHDVVYAIMDWVERGKAPDSIIATKFQNDTNPDAGVYRQRPLCVYPAQAVYQGGDVDRAERWTCEPLFSPANSTGEC